MGCSYNWVDWGLSNLEARLRNFSDSITSTTISSLWIYYPAHAHTLHWKTESAASMSFYIQLTFLAVCLMSGLIIGDGKFSGWNDPSLEFLFRAWSWPNSDHYSILILIGTTSAFGGFFISQAYRMSEAAVVAPFEYIALPIAIFWGVLVFGEWPDKTTFIGIALILGSGLYIIWRETILKDAETPKIPRYRR